MRMRDPWPTVEVVSTKWNGDFHRRTPSLELGSDQSGTWLWMPPGTVAETPAGPYDAIPGLRLLPVGRMWSAYFVPSFPATPRPASIYIDINSPIRRQGDRFEFVDFDLDIEQIGDAAAAVLDREEFDDRCRRWSYPEATVALAESTCAEILEAVDLGRTPFDGSYLTWWQQTFSRPEM